VVSDVVRQQVPEGYQRTEVGVIPEDWDIKPISECADVSSGGTPNRKNKDYWNGNIPWVTTTLIDGKEINAAKQFITDKGIIGSATKWYSAGTLLMAMYGQGKTRGKVSTLGIDATINQACAGIAVKRLLDSQFLLHYLIGRYDDIRNLSNSGGQENLSGEIIKHIFVPVPKKEEQTAIANALSDVDALITSLEKLIAKKRAIKTAAMQQLLTGKKRLPPFDTLATKNGTPAYRQTELGETPVDWEVSKIGEVAEFVGGSQPPKSTFKSAEKIGHIRLIQIRDYKKDTYATYIPEVLAQKKCNASDIMIGRYGPPIFQILRGIKGAYNVALIKAIPNSKVFKEFLYYTLKTEALFQIMEVLSQRSSGQTGVDLPALKAYPLALPTIEEQKSIVSALNDMDTEIDTLNKRLTKTQQLKQGMMQELLTGRTRLL
jgi:type I restriction enzyme S subunit